MGGCMHFGLVASGEENAARARARTRKCESEI